MKFKQAAFMVVCFVLCAGVLPAGDHFEVERRIIYPDEFKAGKPYSPGVLVGETLYISGQIDRVLVTPDEVTIIDYKTNRPPPARPEDVPAVYLRQLAAYRSAIALIFPGKRIRCALLWTDGAKLMPLGDELLDAHAP